MEALKNMIGIKREQRDLPVMGYWQLASGHPRARQEVERHIKPMTDLEKTAALAYMGHAIRGPGYRGSAWCRVCPSMKEQGIRNVNHGVGHLGSCDMITPDGKWRFPEKWEHYITEHGVRPTKEQFIRDAVAWVSEQAPKRVSDQEYALDVTGYLSPFTHDGQPVALQLTGCDDRFVVVWEKGEDLREMMGDIPFDKIVKVEHGPTFLESVLGHFRVAVMADGEGVPCTVILYTGYVEHHSNGACILTMRVQEEQTTEEILTIIAKALWEASEEEFDSLYVAKEDCGHAPPRVANYCPECGKSLKNVSDEARRSFFEQFLVELTTGICDGTYAQYRALDSLNVSMSGKPLLEGRLIYISENGECVLQHLAGAVGPEHDAEWDWKEYVEGEQNVTE